MKSVCTILLLALQVLSVNAFAPQHSVKNTFVTRVSNNSFKPLYAEDKESSPLEVEEEESESYGGMFAKEMNSGEEKEYQWRDDRMASNTTPTFGVVGYIFILFPLILFANDVFHFLPENIKL